MAGISRKPWSNFSEADYTLEQWHRACLIHQHTGAPTAKTQCKLPVLEPDGTLNVNAVHAAAAALGGARGGLNATDQQKDSARRALLRLYAKINEEPPVTIQHNDIIERIIRNGTATPNELKSFMSVKHADVPSKSLVIVALPSDLDPVQSIGSEEKHSTLLWLGNDVPQGVYDLILASLHSLLSRGMSPSPFWEHVSKVASLGPEGARVWLIDSNNGLRLMRERLLSLPAIKAAFDSQAQYPNFTPHVTIGYPSEGQEKLDPTVENAAGDISTIRFDRIALWYGDNHDVIWKLRYDDEADVAYSEEVGEFLAHHGVSLQHAERSIQDVIDEMSAKDRDIMDLFVGAALDDQELPEEDPDVILYEAMSDEKKAAIDFVVGGALQKDYTLEHVEDDLTDFLAHHGIKGQKWGVRRDAKELGSFRGVSVTRGDKKAAKERLKAGTGSLEDAHKAALKSVGHRVANAFLGDKTYWKTAAIAGGIAIAGTALALTGPASLVPIGVALANGGNTAGTVASFTNLYRAITGNRRVEKSFDSLINHASKTQREGSEKVKKLLRKSGSVKGKYLKQDDDLADFFEHHGIKGMKWGVRRTDAQLGRLNRKQAKLAAKQAKLDEQQKKLDKTGESKGAVRVGPTNGKLDDETFLSADAERFVKTLGKDQISMSDREIKEAINRANMIKQYNELFGSKDNPNSALESQVKTLRLQKEKADLTRALTPEKKSAVASLVKAASSGFSTFQSVDKTMNGNLSKALSKKLGLVDSPSALQKLNAENQMLAAKKTNAQLSKDLQGLLPPIPKTIKNAPLSRNLSTEQKYVNYAKQAVQDAKDLNSILDDILK